jgi:hypothetical protein
MFKTLIARMRGNVRLNGAADSAHPLIAVDRQRIDAEGRVDLARRRLSLARAAREAERARLAATDRRIAALEYRAVQALAEDRAPMARQAADLIARLSADRVWSLGVLRTRAAENDRLAEEVALAEAHLGRVVRAGRIIRAEEVVRQLRASTASMPPPTRHWRRRKRRSPACGRGRRIASLRHMAPALEP